MQGREESERRSTVRESADRVLSATNDAEAVKMAQLPAAEQVSGQSVEQVRGQSVEQVCSSTACLTDLWACVHALACCST